MSAKQCPYALHQHEKVQLQGGERRENKTSCTVCIASPRLPCMVTARARDHVPPMQSRFHSRNVFTVIVPLQALKSQTFRANSQVPNIIAVSIHQSLIPGRILDVLFAYALFDWIVLISNIERGIIRAHYVQRIKGPTTSQWSGGYGPIKTRSRESFEPVHSGDDGMMITEW
ncbi:uncharacterized protein EI97DRAFT_217152 [Westerdykella ornata]|uniref:Uncharacterized protein n=1 Tax=Westerdykella ornata TaxID=318751 RepID=A0A6A6JUJ9_WESOR|nr:uncharacterized protein EI97DRAFT_217152 [Westerdykella ornata]KAF2278709.1 hypothetical protein EI97DRAFT_217152 [Westerdykella ornata]